MGSGGTNIKINLIDLKYSGAWFLFLGSWDALGDYHPFEEGLYLGHISLESIDFVIEMLVVVVDFDVLIGNALVELIDYVLDTLLGLSLVVDFEREEYHVEGLDEFVLLLEGCRVLKIEEGSEPESVVDGILHHGDVALSNDSDQEVHEHDGEQDDIQQHEDEPNQGNHIVRSPRILTPRIVPNRILWSYNITNRVSYRLKQE